MSAHPTKFILYYQDHRHIGPPTNLRSFVFSWNICYMYKHAQDMQDTRSYSGMAWADPQFARLKLRQKCVAAARSSTRLQLSGFLLAIGIAYIRRSDEPATAFLEIIAMPGFLQVRKTGKSQGICAVRERSGENIFWKTLGKWSSITQMASVIFCL